MDALNECTVGAREAAADWPAPPLGLPTGQWEAESQTRGTSLKRRAEAQARVSVSRDSTVSGCVLLLSPGGEKKN